VATTSSARAPLRGGERLDLLDRAEEVGALAGRQRFFAVDAASQRLASVRLRAAHLDQVGP